MSSDPDVKAFNKMLFATKESKAISKEKMNQLTKQAMSCHKHYKHVVLSVEKFIAKCNPKCKLTGFYVIDSIVRRGIKQQKEKDVFGPRFAKNLPTTLENAISTCADGDKLKIVRVLNLWKTHAVFPTELIDSLLNYCRQCKLDVDIESVEMKVKGQNANMSVYDQQKKKKHTPRTPPPPSRSGVNESTKSHKIALNDVAPPNGVSEKEMVALLQRELPQWAPIFQKDTVSFRKFSELFNGALKERVNRERAANGANISSILCQSFEYSDDEDQEEKKATKDPNESMPREKIEGLAEEVFADSEFRNLLADLHGCLIVTPFSAAPLTNLPAFSQPGPSGGSSGLPPNPWTNSSQNSSFGVSDPFSSSFDRSVNGSNGSQPDSESRERKRGRSRSPSDPRKQRRSHRSRRSQSSSDTEKEKEKERERRRIGLPSHPRRDCAVIASRTLWFGRLPQNCVEQEIRDAVKDFGPPPEKINIISSRVCAYVTFANRKTAFKIMDKHRKDINVNGRNVKIDWAHGAGFSKNDRLLDYWNGDRGFSEIPHSKLPSDLSKILEGSHLDVSTLPSEMKGKYGELGPKEEAETLPVDIPMPVQLPIDLPPIPYPQQPPPSAIGDPSTISLPPGLPTGLPPPPPISLAGGALFDPAIFAAVLARQQQQNQFNTLLTAIQQQQNSAGAAGLLPTPSPNAGPPNMFTAQFGGANGDAATDRPPQSLGNTALPPTFDGQPRGGFGGFRGGRGNFRPPGGGFFGRPRFNGPSGDFRPRGGGSFRGGPPRESGFSAFPRPFNPQPVPAFVPPSDTQEEPMDESQ